jgi:hypothetical protein
MTRFLFIVGLLFVLMLATHIGRTGAREGWGLSDDFSNVTVRSGSVRRGGRVYVGGGFHGGK